MRVIIIWEFFSDMFHRRVGWAETWFRFAMYPGAYELRVGPILVIVTRRNRK